MRIIFIGLSGYSYPHTRVRCFNFAAAAGQLPGVETEVLSFRDHLAPERSEAEMFDRLGDKFKLQLTWQALRRLARERGDTIFYVQKAHFHSAAPFLLHRLLGYRYILDYDDYDVDLSVFYHRGALNRIAFGSHKWDRITAILAERALGCVAASHGLQEFLRQYNRRVALIPTGVDTARFAAHPRPSSEPVVFIWTGLVWGEAVFKNVEMLIQAFSVAAAQCPGILLRLVGGGQWFGKVEELLSHDYPRLPVEIVGWTHPDKIPELLNAADVGLLPFAESDQWTSCKSPTKLFEYMACGLTVLSSPVGEVRYVIQPGENGILCDDASAFAAAMIQVAQDPALRQRLGRQARATVEAKYALPSLGRQLVEQLQMWTECP